MNASENRISTAEARKHLKVLIGKVAYNNERVVLTRHREDEAALVPIRDLAIINYLIAEDLYDGLLKKVESEK